MLGSYCTGMCTVTWVISFITLAHVWHAQSHLMMVMIMDDDDDDDDDDDTFSVSHMILIIIFYCLE